MVVAELNREVAADALSRRMATRLEQSLQATVSWVIGHQYRAFEPADGNLSPLHRLTFRNVMAMRVLQQVVLRAPFNLRPFLGVPPHESAIARGYMAWGFACLDRMPGWHWARPEAMRCFEWLIGNRAAASAEYCWGDPYEYATRAGRRPLGEPLLIWTALIGLAFLDAFERWQEERLLNVAMSIGRWIQRLPVEKTPTGSCLSYVGSRQSSIHNASVMGAAFLARLGATTRQPELIAAAREVVRYTCSRQRDDGSWLYAEEPKYHWVDNFHTGYNLSALKIYRTSSGDSQFDGQMFRGLAYFRSTFFEADGRPRYFDERRYPTDIQCAAQSIDTLAAFSDDVPECLPQALSVAEWTINEMQAPDGHFYYRDLGWTKVRTPMLHWGQASMIKAMASLLTQLSTRR